MTRGRPFFDCPPSEATRRDSPPPTLGDCNFPSSTAICAATLALFLIRLMSAKELEVNRAENCRNHRFILVCRLLPDVILDTAARTNGVTSLPSMPARSASESAFAMELLMTSSARKVNFRLFRNNFRSIGFNYQSSRVLPVPAHQ